VLVVRDCRRLRYCMWHNVWLRRDCWQQQHGELLSSAAAGLR
jgi:hypothetical protein